MRTIWPGYGFLSKNFLFALACEKKELILLD
ncbi:biotin carboxylase N-terminal domain-containing protein [Candidatus Pantoea edessiphila]